MLREAQVSGMFYESDAPALKKHISKYIIKVENKYKAKGIIVPHAGYIYSGKVAGEVFSSIEIPDILIILGPNHTGLGKSISVMTQGIWRTPLGDCRINEPVANEIIRNCKFAQKDTMAHLKEHSIEVELPFIQYLKPSFSFVPICLAESDLDKLSKLGEVIANIIKGKDILLIASTDLTHYEDAKTAERKDKLVLDAIMKLDPEKMVKEIYENDISMCGWMPVFVLLKACKISGAKEGKIIKYANSGEVSGDYEQVVGYGGAVII